MSLVCNRSRLLVFRARFSGRGQSVSFIRAGSGLLVFGARFRGRGQSVGCFIRGGSGLLVFGARFSGRGLSVGCFIRGGSGLLIFGARVTGRGLGVGCFIRGGSGLLIFGARVTGRGLGVGSVRARAGLFFGAALACLGAAQANHIAQPEGPARRHAARLDTEQAGSQPEGLGQPPGPPADPGGWPLIGWDPRTHIAAR